MKHTAVANEFSRFAHSYDAHSVIQEEVAKTLVDSLPKKDYNKVIDIGCGSGAIYQSMRENNIEMKKFIALDVSSQMLDIHPSHPSVKKICADFNSEKAFTFFNEDENLVISASALQWSKDLEFTFSNLAKTKADSWFAIFTAGTFKTLHKYAGVESPIYSCDQLQKNVDKFYHASYEVKKYKLHFPSVREMFRYIKKSGVSGGEQQLSYKQTKGLMEKYPLDYLEFEVLFVRAEPLTKGVD